MSLTKNHKVKWTNPQKKLLSKILKYCSYRKKYFTEKLCIWYKCNFFIYCIFSLKSLFSTKIAQNWKSQWFFMILVKNDQYLYKYEFQRKKLCTKNVDLSKQHIFNTKRFKLNQKLLFIIIWILYRNNFWKPVVHSFIKWKLIFLLNLLSLMNNNISFLKNKGNLLNSCYLFIN